MKRQILLVEFEPRSTPPQGEPPSFEVSSGTGTVTVLEGDPDRVPHNLSYTTRVTVTGETTFDEEGELTFDGGGFSLATLGSGVLEPSAEEGTARGAVSWRVEGTGSWSGVTGFLSSNFEVDTATGNGRERQVLRLFVP
jgi:hypothetical protein